MNDWTLIKRREEIGKDNFFTKPVTLTFLIELISVYFRKHIKTMFSISDYSELCSSQNIIALLLQRKLLILTFDKHSRTSYVMNSSSIFVSRSTVDWKANVGEDAQEDWGEVCGHFCNPETNDRGLKLLDFAIYNNLVLANISHPEDGNGPAQMEHITTTLTASS